MKKLTAAELCRIAICTALIAILAQISIPLPLGVPMTLQTLAVPLAGILIGAKGGTIATCIYLLLGAVGVPVFAGFTGGLGSLLGMTGGFLISFPLMAWLAGWGYEKGTKLSLAAGLVLGAVLNYAIGTVWFVVVAESTFATALSACVIPFIPTAIIKLILAGWLGVLLRTRLVKAGVLEGRA